MHEVQATLLEAAPLAGPYAFPDVDVRWLASDGRVIPAGYSSAKAWPPGAR